MIRKLKSINYRHYICSITTIGFLCLGVLFPNGIPRILESIKDLFNACAYYFCWLFFDENPITPTFNQIPSWQFAPSPFELIKLFPWTWEEFKALWPAYWEQFFSLENLGNYCLWLFDMLYLFTIVLSMLLPLIIIVWLIIREYLKTQNNDYNVDSKQLKRWKKFLFKYVYPINRWFRAFAEFMNEYSAYKKLWIAIWVLHFNIIPIAIGLITWYIYFISSMDVTSILWLLLRLTYDLTPMVRFIPVPVWILIGFWVLNFICRKQAFARLYHNENKNRGFINERGVVTVIYGNMGVGKTSLVTSMALSAEAELRDMAFEILLETDVKFPNFPWCNLREEMKRQIEKHRIVDIHSVRRWVKGLREMLQYTDENPLWWARQRRKRYNRFDYTFAYDRKHFPVTYNDGLKVIELYDAIEDYACAYFIYTVQTSLIISNYSVRTDAIYQDIGNFPVWDSDFFKRDPELMDAYSRHCHIIDFDMLRLGKRMIEDNPNRNAFGFGVYLVSEIDKERKNALELKETKINEAECNQRNDLFNACLKMCRHAVVIANRVFLKIICDLQRPEDWGAGGREVGEIVFIAEKGDTMPTLPFYSPFWFCEWLFNCANSLWKSFYTSYIVNRSDNTLFTQLLKGLFARLEKHYTYINNQFGCQTLYLEVESGRMNGDAKESKYYRMPKKDFAKRYSTNCLSAIFEGDEVNRISINDLAEYANIMATAEELASQNSFFQNDLAKAKRQGEAAVQEVKELPKLTSRIDTSLLSVYDLLFVGDKRRTPSEEEE